MKESSRETNTTKEKELDRGERTLAGGSATR